MSKLVFESYEGDDPNGTPNGELTEAFGKFYVGEHNGPGAGELLISRHSSTQSVWTRPDKYIKVYLDDTSGDPIGGFWITQSSDEVLSPDEDGAEVYRRQGPGSLYYLADAIVWYEQVIDDTGLIDSASPTPNGDRWQWQGTGVFPGGVLVRMLEEAQARGCLTELTYDFTRTLDSDGNAWPGGDTGLEMDLFELEVGMNLLEVVGKLQELGLVVRMDADLVLHAWQSQNDAPVGGDDLSATVVFEKGVNIATSAQREIYASGAKSTNLVKGKRSDNGEITWVEASSAAALTELGRRKEGFIDAQETTGFDVLQRMGETAIYRQLRLRSGPTSLGVDEVAMGKEAFVDFFPSDIVTVDIPGVYNDVEKQLTSVSLTENDAGECDVVVAFDEAPGREPTPPTLVGPTQSEPDDCPFFVNTDNGVATPNLAMRMRNYGDDAFYTTIGASEGDATNDDALLTLKNGNANLQALADSGNDFAEINLDANNAGDITMTLSQTFTVDIDGTDANSKAYFVGGWGLVLPSGTGEPSGPNSEAGQLWYDESTNEAKWYDGTNWQVFGSTGGGGSGDVATDTIWNAKGDLAVGTGSDTAARLAVGTNASTIVADSAATTGIRWRLNNDAASAAPTVNDDTGDGYTIGSRWLDTTNDKEYVALDVSSGAAVWVETTGAGQFTDDVANTTLRVPTGYWIGAAEGTATEDAQFDASVDLGGNASVSIGSFDASGESFWRSSGRAVEGSGEVVTLTVMDTDADSKHKLNGGHGLVVPRLASDPSGGNSEEGQIYFNTTSDTFRGFDGSVWGELALT